MIGIRKKDTIFAKNIAVTISDSKLISGEATHYLAEKIAEASKWSTGISKKP